MAGAVSSSERSTQRLRALGIEVVDSNRVTSLAVYVDGADEIDATGCMIKGGGGALTREKIVADLAEQLICIVDESKCVQRLGAFALPVEVIPMASAQVSRRLAALGARVVPRAGFVTDNGCSILDAHGLLIDEPAALEARINQWPGVVTVGLFAQQACRSVPGRHGARRQDAALLRRARRAGKPPEGSGGKARTLAAAVRDQRRLPHR